MRRTSTLSVSLAAACLSMIGTLTLTSCSASGASVSTTTSSVAATASPTATSTSLPANVVRAQRTFDGANKALATSNSSAGDEDIVAALVRAGFSKDVMQITADETTIGRRVDSIEVSVRVDDTCLLGEFRGSSYVGTTAPVLSGDRCLVGTTRDIDW